MRTRLSILLALAATLASTTPARPETLLVLVDQQTMQRHQAQLAEWRLAVERERRFDAIEWDVRPRALHTNESVRQQEVAQIMSRVRSLKPRAVQIFGAVAMPASGRHIPDGHPENEAVAWTDVPYMVPDYRYTDTAWKVINRGSDQNNIPGDYRWDQNWLTGGRIVTVVARVNFSEMYGNGGGLRTNACEGATSIHPPLDEDREFAAYLRRNLNYRSGAFQVPAAGLWQLERPSTSATKAMYLDSLKGVSWETRKDLSQFVGSRARYMFAGWILSYRTLLFDSNCELPFFVWFCNYKSNEWAVFGPHQPMSRALLFGLVATWGDSYFRFSDESRIVADDLWVTADYWKPRTGVGVLYTVMGDLTLPYEQPVPPAAVDSLRVDPSLVAQ